MRYWENGKIVRDVESEAPGYISDDHSLDKYMGIRIVERDEMNNEDNRKRLKSLFELECEEVDKIITSYGTMNNPNHYEYSREHLFSSNT